MLPTYHEVKQSVAGAIDELERVRRPLRKKRTMYNWIVLAAAAMAVMLYMVGSSLFLASILIVAVVIFLWYRYWSKSRSLFRSLFKQTIVAPLMQAMLELISLPNETDDYEYVCEYSPEERIDDDWIKSSRLFDIDIDKIYGEDLFRGKLGLTDFMFSELRLVQKQHSTDSKGNTTTTYVDVFKGVLFIADFHKDFDGITILDSNVGSGGFFGKMLGRLRSTTYKAPIKISLENEQFNRMFQVRTTDEIKAKYLLPSNMMERIAEFKKKRKDLISISFVDSYMCVSLWSQKNYFEAKMSRAVTDETLQSIYEDLKFFFGLIEEFDLNKRIWGKH